MPIRKLAEGRVFDPEMIALIEGAYAAALVTLEISNRDDPATRLIAEKVLDLFEDGVTNQAELYRLVVAAFQKPNSAKH